MNEDRLEILMVKVVDGMATADERQELMSQLHGRPDLQVELDAHLALKATTDGWVERLALDRIEDAWTANPVQRVERVVGLTLVLGGVSVLTGFGLVTLLVDPTAPLWVKLGVSALVAGLSILMLSAIRWRLHTRKHDRYSEVIR
jgi:anti-sigma factor RsiW